MIYEGCASSAGPSASIWHAVIADNLHHVIMSAVWLHVCFHYIIPGSSLTLELVYINLDAQILSFRSKVCWETETCRFDGKEKLTSKNNKKLWIWKTGGIATKRVMQAFYYCCWQAVYRLTLIQTLLPSVTSCYEIFAQSKHCKRKQ